jgi:hypothetical protein
MRLIVFLILFGSFCHPVNASELDEVRKAFYRASMEQEVCEEIYNKIKDRNYSEKPLLLGYRGVYQAIMAKYLWNPFSKWWYFRSGVEQLETAISKDNDNIELIFLRFSIQTNCPEFLGYNSKITSDKDFILTQMHDKKVVWEYRTFMADIINYLMDSKFLSEKEKEFLTQVRADLKSINFSS